MASGRLGYKCIPPYTACEIYSNSSGSPASVSISAQVFSSSENDACITTAISDCAVTLSNSSTISTGTNCFCQTVGFSYDYDNFCGSYIQGPEDCYSTINKYVNKANTTTTCGARSTNPAPYGGNEIILPTSDNKICTAVCDCNVRPNWVTVTFDCCGERPLIIHSLRTQCNWETQAQLFVNPYCTCGDNATYGYDFATYGCCSIEEITCRLCPLTDVKDYVINYYGPGFLGGGCQICNNCELYTLCCCIDAVECAISNDIMCNSFDIVGFGTSTCAACTRILFTSGSRTFGTRLCDLCVTPLRINCTVNNPGCNSGIACTVCTYVSTEKLCCRNCWFQNDGFGNCMSPYGVQRAATNRAFIWAFCNGAAGSGYYLNATVCNIVCNCSNTCGKGFWININHSQCCEFPVKYLSYNPSEDSVYLMARSENTCNCGIFKLNYRCFYGCINANDTSNCPTSIPNLTDHGLFDRVSDFPSTMAKLEYTSPMMCVSCLFRDSSSTWNIRIWNHTTSKWDSFSTSNLVNWSLNDNYTYRTSNVEQYNAFDSCVISQTNKFDSNMPVCNYIDYKVQANNFERTGVVISNGDRVIINNDSDAGIAAQVWGYEG